jgi:hypothetical protein
MGQCLFSWRFALVLVAGADVLGFNFGSLRLLTNDGCLRPVIRRRVTRRHFVMIEPVDCDKIGSPARIPLAG